MELNSSRYHLDQFIRNAARSVQAGALMLDAGCGRARYRQHFLDAGLMYENADFASVPNTEYAELTYTCRLEAIPVDNSRYDMVVLTQVLEHLPDPLAVLRELHRILKPGAALWLTAPLYYEEHQQPYDFYRYTQFGFRHLLETAGFSVKNLEWLEGYYGTVSYQLELASRSLPRGAIHYGGGLKGKFASLLGMALRPICRRFAKYYARLDMRCKYLGSGHPKNYAVIARKP